MVLKVFLDANVLFAAAYNPTSRIRNFFVFAELKACILLASPLALTETRRNLQLKRPDALPRLDDLVRHVTVVPEAPTPMLARLASLLPPKDQPILAAAVLADANWLVTGDEQHFGHLYGQLVGSTEVLRPAEALRRLAEAE